MVFHISHAETHHIHLRLFVKQDESGKHLTYFQQMPNATVRAQIYVKIVVHSDKWYFSEYSPSDTEHSWVYLFSLKLEKGNNS